MKNVKWLAPVLFMLVLLGGCASNAPAEPAADEAPAMDAQAEPVAAEKVPEIPVFEPREPYRLNEVETQLLQNGDEITVDGICRFTVKGFGCGRMVTADGNTCAGAKKGEVLVWLTCDYVNLRGAKVSSKKLIKQAHIRYDGGYSVGKSASFSKIIPDETVEVYFYYPIPEALDTESVTMEFTIGEQAYRYEVPADRAGAIEPTFPKQDEPEEEEKQPITTVEAPPNESEKPEKTTPSPVQNTPVDASRQERYEYGDGGYGISYYDDSDRVIRQESYGADGSLKSYNTLEYNIDGTGMMKYSMYDQYGNLLSYRTDEQTDTGMIETFYDQSGKRTLTRYYGIRGNGYSVVKVIEENGTYYTCDWHDDGSRTVVYYRADGALDHTVYIDAKGKMTKIEYPDGTVEIP